MSLEKRNISISFYQGLDTKTDPNQVIAGKLESLQNVVFSEGMAFNKRNGYGLLATLGSANGVNLSTFKSELVAFDGTNLNSYSPSTQTTISKGALVSVDLSVNAIYRTSTQQITQDSAFNAAGLFLYVWVDSQNGAQYIIVSSSTGNQIVAATSLVATAVLPRAWAIGNYLIVTYVDSATNHLRYISIPVLNPTNPSAPTDLSTLVNSSNPNYDGIVVNNNLYLSWNGSDGGGAIRTTYLDQNLNQHSTAVQAGENASVAITVFADSGVSTPTIWIAYCNGSNIRYFILSSNGLSSVLAPTQIVGSLGTINNISGYASNGNGTVFYQTQNTYSYSTVRTDFISSVSATSLGVVGSPSVFMRSVGLISKPFTYNKINYFVVAYNGSLQPTYFVVDQNGNIITKIAYSNGGGYTNSASLTTVNNLSVSSQFQFAYLYKNLLSTQQGQVYTLTGVNSATIDFSAQDIYQTAELGNNLNTSGGFLWMYDGYGAVEQNFHIFPENLGFTATTGLSPSNIAPNTYNYVAIYQWMDNQGNIHRSGYAPSSAIVIPGSATSGITVSIPTLRLTAKQNTRSPVSITLYRTQPSISTQVFYRTSSITVPTLNNTTVDSVQITDTNSDAALTGNELLYTTGGVLQDSGAPAAAALTIYKNRVVLVTGEERNTLWYSKVTLQGTPVEMSQSATLYIDPRFGGMSALAVMDDKLILFKQNALFYMTGDGPDATGANSDFTEAVFITSVVGCTNFKSIVLTPDGLMFQSNKGIWLLDRGLNVSYVGAPVEAYNGFNITSAQLIPGTTQVRFTLSSGISLVYDYFYKAPYMVGNTQLYIGQWGTFTNQNAMGAVIFGNLHTYLKSNGQILQETPGIYTDNGQPFFMGLTTSWLSLAGLQGFQRAYRLYLMGQLINPHIITASIAYDYDAASTQATTIQPSILYNNTYGGDPFYGASQFYGGNSLQEQFRINLSRQKCQSIQIKLLEGIDTQNPVYGPALVLENMGIVVGTKSSYPRLPATQIVTG